MEASEKEKRVSGEKKHVTPPDIVCGLVLSVLFVSFSVTFTLNFTPLYHNDIKALGIEQRTGLPASEISRDYDTLVSYNNLLGPDELEFKNFVMSESGRIHFREVRAIFHGFEWALVISLLIILITRYLRYRAGSGSGTDQLSGTPGGSDIPGRLSLFSSAELVTAAVSPFAAIAVIASAILILGWNRVFVIFHHIAFDNDYWIFDETTDPIIKALPEEFFLHEALLILFVLAALCVLALIAALYKAKLKKGLYN